MSQHEKQISKPMLYAGLGALIIMTMIGISYFTYAVFTLGKDLSNHSDNISFNKGAFYLLGASIGLASIVFAGIYESGLGHTLSKALGSTITKVALAGLIIMLVLPHVTHYFVSSAVESDGYSICDAASHQWLYSKTIVFTRNEEACRLLTAVQ